MGAPIKLYNIGKIDNGVTRLQSQLFLGRDKADFIMEKDGTVKELRYNNGSLGFHKFKGEYEIVNNIKEMMSQEL